LGGCSSSQQGTKGSHCVPGGAARGVPAMGSFYCWKLLGAMRRFHICYSFPSQMASDSSLVLSPIFLFLFLSFSLFLLLFLFLFFLFLFFFFFFSFFFFFPLSPEIKEPLELGCNVEDTCLDGVTCIQQSERDTSQGDK